MNGTVAPTLMVRRLCMKPALCIAVDVGTRNLALAVVEVLASGEGVVYKLATEDISAANADACVLRLWAFLDAVMAEVDARFPLHTLQVLIEQQPSKARSIMRSVELGARHYFLMAGHRSARSVRVKSVSSRCKLGAPVRYEAGATRAQRYAARKRASVEEMSAAMRGAPASLRAMRCGKADDVADCLCYIARQCGVSAFIDVDMGVGRDGLGRQGENDGAATDTSWRK